MKRMMRFSILIAFLAIPLMTSLAYGKGPTIFKAMLIPCNFTCPPNLGPGTEAFVAPGEPVTVTGEVEVDAGGTLKVKVSGATPNVTYQVLVGNFVTGPTLLPIFLTTDASGGGTVTGTVPPGTYISLIFLMRDADLNGTPEPRILTGYVIP